MSFPDYKLGVHPLAWAIYNLVDINTSDVRGRSYWKTTAWYNGRECGICIVVPAAGGSVAPRALVITFGECRNIDNIFVDTWTMPENINPPTVNDYPEEAYQRRRTFNRSEVDSAAKYVGSLLKKVP